MKSHSKLNLFAWLFLCLCLTVKAFAQDGMQFAPFMMRSDINDWAQRVVANGGALPSQNTILAMETLRLGCIAAGLTNKIYSLCVFVPDSVIAASTPLFKHFGSDPWTNNNFLSGDLTVNGLKGNGTTKSLDTGVKSKDVQIPANSATIGITVLVTESSSNAQCVVIGQQQADDNRPLVLLVSSSGSTLAQYTSTTVANQNLTNDFGRVGYVSANRYLDGGNTNISIYVASPLESHKTLATAVSQGNQAVATLTDDTISVFAYKHGGTNAGWSPHTLSMAMVHDGFTSAESASFWALVLACRQTLGGGTGDNIHDYNRKIVSFGGAAISTTTSNALRTHYQGLDTDGILYRIIAANPMVPDNLVAARTPLIWQAGAEIWTNNLFAASNLTVNGLQGDGSSKYLGTAIIPSTAVNRGFSTTSAGMSLLMWANPDTAGNGLAAVSSGAANQQWGLFSFSGTGLYRCWLTTLVNQNFVTGTVGTTTNGWLSGNRTAADAIALYKARSDTAHTVVTNATGTQTGAIGTTHALTIYAINNVGVMAAFSAPTLSYTAIHAGLTQTQSSNLYFRASSLRTTLGGGNP